MKHRELSPDELTLVNGGVSELSSLASMFAGAISGGALGATTSIFTDPASAGDFPADTSGYVDASGVPIGNGGVCIDTSDSGSGQIGGIDVSGIDVGSIEVGADVGGGDIGGF